MLNKTNKYPIFGNITDEDISIIETVRRHYIDTRIQDILMDNSIQNEPELKSFLSVIHNETWEFFNNMFTQEMGIKLEPPELVFHYEHKIDTKCGEDTTKDFGPFFCVDDNTVHIHLDFLMTMSKQHGIYGDMALGFILKHENAHSFQFQILGDEQHFMMFIKYLEIKSGIKYDKKKIKLIYQIANSSEPHHLKTLVTRFFEFWADHMASMSTRNLYELNLLEERDLKEIENVVLAIGDDRIQGPFYKEKDSTHGTSAQRFLAMKQGFNTKSLHGSPFEALLVRLGAIIQEPEILKNTSFDRIVNQVFGDNFSNIFGEKFDKIFRKFK